MGSSSMVCFLGLEILVSLGVTSSTPMCVDLNYFQVWEMECHDACRAWYHGSMGALAMTTYSSLDGGIFFLV